ncbi:MAG: AAA family ATPase, partial [Proteobacteria bacterium]|nr:AAA family ATPase [Pseudomonadota bacterium]
MITANLGVLLARQGNRVVLVDLDLGASNLHTFIGQPDTDRGLESFLGKTQAHLDKVAMPTDIANLFFISSRNCLTEAANLYAAQKQKIIRAIQKLEFDYVLMDLGAGTNFNMLDFFLTSNQGIFICTPEPTSIENSFNFIKAVYFRVIK